MGPFHCGFIRTPYFSFRISQLVPSVLPSSLCALSNICWNIITTFRFPGIASISLFAPPRSDTIFGCPAIAVEKASDANTIFRLPVITVPRCSHPKTPSSHHPCTQVRNSDTIFRVPPIALPLNFWSRGCTPLIFGSRGTIPVTRQPFQFDISTSEDWSLPTARG
ncbi:hypothetical protein M413DRAFT_390783 [Hebeloma cylindrosporum]|uniref:Uncharacterized protein n=1 Tax=Hebeloma cylindrosporum TaxID=76867 RepID=A0A0C2Y1Z3_HEBCY|nr:hypothetical protein M413DRAFT_390783 [Hebeloma cylindrosporum h7]